MKTDKKPGIAGRKNATKEELETYSIRNSDVAWRAAPVNRSAKKKKLRVRPFRVFAILLGVGMVALLAQFPQKAVSLERQRQQLSDAAEAYYDAQSRNNQLTAELASVDTSDFIEKTARRLYDYCWYGETIYEVANLEQIGEEPEFEVYGED